MSAKKIMSIAFSVFFLFTISINASSETVILNETSNPHIKISSNDGQNVYFNQSVTHFPWDAKDAGSLPYSPTGLTITLYNSENGIGDSATVSSQSLSSDDGIQVIHTGDLTTSHFTSFPVIRNGAVTLYNPDTGDVIYETTTDNDGVWHFPVHEIDNYENEDVLINVDEGTASLNYSNGAIEALRDAGVPLYAHVRTSSLLRGGVTVSLPTHIAYTAASYHKDSLSPSDYKRLLKTNMRALTATGTSYDGNLPEEALYLSSYDKKVSSHNFLFTADEIPIKQYSGDCKSLFLSIVNCSNASEVNNLYRARFNEFVYGLSDIPITEITQKKLIINVFGGAVLSENTSIRLQEKPTNTPLWHQYETDFLDVGNIANIRVVLGEEFNLVRWEGCESVTVSCSTRIENQDFINVFVEPKNTVDKTLELNEFIITVNDDFSVNFDMIGDLASAQEKISNLYSGSTFKTSEDDYFLIDAIEKDEFGNLLSLSVFPPDKKNPGEELAGMESGRIIQISQTTNEDYFNSLLPGEEYKPNIAVPTNNPSAPYFISSGNKFSKEITIASLANVDAAADTCKSPGYEIEDIEGNTIVICDTQKLAVSSHSEEFFNDGNGLRIERRVSTLLAGVSFELSDTREASFNFMGNPVIGFGPYMQATINGEFSASIGARVERTRYYTSSTGGEKYLQDVELRVIGGGSTGNGSFQSSANLSGEGGLRAFVDLGVVGATAEAKVRFDFVEQKINNFNGVLPAECESRDLLTATGLLSLGASFGPLTVGKDSSPLFVKNLFPQDVPDHCELKFKVEFSGDDILLIEPTSDSSYDYTVTNSENTPVEIKARLSKGHANAFSLSGKKAVTLNQGESHTFKVDFIRKIFSESNLTYTNATLSITASPVSDYGVRAKPQHKTFKLSAKNESQTGFRTLVIPLVSKFISPGVYSYHVPDKPSSCGKYGPVKDGRTCEYLLNPEKWKILSQVFETYPGGVKKQNIENLGAKFKKNMMGASITSGFSRAWAVPTHINGISQHYYDNTHPTPPRFPVGHYDLTLKCLNEDTGETVSYSKSLLGRPSYSGHHKWYYNGSSLGTTGFNPGITGITRMFWGDYRWGHRNGDFSTLSGGPEFNFVDNQGRTCVSTASGPTFHN